VSEGFATLLSRVVTFLVTSRASLRMDPPGPTTTGLCRDMIGRESGAHTITRACLAMSLIFVATATWRHRSATRGTLNGPRR
jgi:hypothetical protein